MVERFDAIPSTEDLRQLDQLCGSDMVNHSLAASRPAGGAATRQWLASDGRKFQSFR
jgi:hypothetical protein